MTNLDITLEDVLNEYNKYLLSKLINKDYNFNNLKDKVKEFSKKSDLFNYNDNLSEAELISNIIHAQNDLLKDNKE